MFKKMILKLKNKIGDRFEPTIRKMCGIKDINETLDSIYYILNHGMDITQFPKADGLLRQLQLGDTELLRIFHELCKKHHLTYWLTAGTLLGGVRHRGFIPWDDDLDVDMPREDYDKARELLPKELERLGISFYDGGGILTIYIAEAGLKLDIFAMDNVSAEAVSGREELLEREKKYIEFRKSCSSAKIRTDEKRMEIIGRPGGHNALYYHELEFYPSLSCLKQEIIYPLGVCEFEGLSFWVPNNVDEYLRQEYGDYMSFPRKRMLVHKGCLTKIVKSGCDMDLMIRNLKGIKF